MELDIGFIEKVLESSKDFKEIDDSLSYFRKPEKIGFDYRIILEASDSIKDDDDVIYRILYHACKKENESTSHYIYKAMSEDLLQESSIKKIYDISCTLGSELEFAFLRYVLSRFLSIKNYEFYLKRFVSAYKEKYDIKNEDLSDTYRKIGLKELEKKNYVLSLRFLNMSMKNGGGYENRGTITEIYNDIGLTEEAVSYAKKSVKITHGLPWAYVHLAISYYHNKNIADAYESIMIAHQAEPWSKWCSDWREKITKEYKHDFSERKSESQLEELFVADVVPYSQRNTFWERKYHDAIMNVEWLPKKSIIAGNGMDKEVGYNYLYPLFRILDEYHPKRILEFNFGQATKLCAQYASAYKKVHTVLEYDRDRVEHFMRCWDIPWGNTSIHGSALLEMKQNGREGIFYQGFERIVGKRKYDLFLIKCPFVENLQIHLDILPRIPGILCDDFAILIDHVETDEGQLLIRDIMKQFTNHKIRFIEKDFLGTDRIVCVLASEGWKYITEF